MRLATATIRRAGRWLFREAWHRLRSLGLTLPPEALLRSPLDLKVGRHFLDGTDEKRLLAVCDFASISVSYDILKLLAVADHFREETGCRWLDIAFIAHHSDPFPSPHSPNNPITIGNHRAYIHNWAIDAVKLMPAAGDVLFFNHRPAFTDYWRSVRRSQPIFPPDYDPRRPNFETSTGAAYYGMIHLRGDDGRLHAPLVAPEVDCGLVRAWLASRAPARSRIVTITLRETSLRPRRNSDIAAWQELVDSYCDADLCFVVLQDHSGLYRGHSLAGPNVVHCPEAVLSLSFRAALYQEAWLNMMVANGPATLCYLNSRTCYIVTCMGTDGEPGSDRELLLLHGLRHGDQLTGNDPMRRLVWETDRFDILRRELDAAVAQTRSGCPTGSQPSPRHPTS